MEKNKKLEIEPNKPTIVTLLSDRPKIGTSTYGEWYLYNLRNGDGVTELSYFAPPEVHEKLKDLKKGSEVVITKLAANRNNKIAITYAVEVKSIPEVSSAMNNTTKEDDFYYTAMEKSLDYGQKLVSKYQGLQLGQIAISIFIQMTKSQNNHY